MELGVKVYGVVGDNSSNMSLARTLLEETQNLSGVFCTAARFVTTNVFIALYLYFQAHWLNFAIKDLLKNSGREKVVNDTTNVLQNFRTRHNLASALEQLDCNRPTMPCPTRWGTTTKALAYYNKKWAYLAQCAATHLPPGHQTRRTLELATHNRAVCLV